MKMYEYEKTQGILRMILFIAELFANIESYIYICLTPPLFLSLSLSLCVCLSLSLCPPPVDHDIGVEPLI